MAARPHTHRCVYVHANTCRHIPPPVPLPHQVYSDLTTAKAFGWSVKTHMALAAYRASLFAEAASSGLPPVRPVWLYHPGDPQAQALRYEAYFGRDLLYCPALDPLRAPIKDVKYVDCYLPGGPSAWAPVWTGSLAAGKSLACTNGTAAAASAAAASGCWARVRAQVGCPALLARREGYRSNAPLMESLNALAALAATDSSRCGTVDASLLA